MKRESLLVVVFIGLLTCPLAGQLAGRFSVEAANVSFYAANPLIGDSPGWWNW